MINRTEIEKISEAICTLIENDSDFTGDEIPPVRLSSEARMKIQRAVESVVDEPLDIPRFLRRQND